MELTHDKGYVPRNVRESVDLSQATRRKWHSEVKRLFRPANNGYNDPLSHLLLVDTVMRLKPDQMIRAVSLRDVLRKECPQMVWDSVTIGRILNELTDLAKSERRPGQRAHISTGRDRFGTYFTIEPGAEPYQWLAGLRAHASEMVDHDFGFLRQGLEPPTRAFSVWDSLTSSPTTAIGVGMAAIAIVPSDQKMGLFEILNRALGL